MFEAALCLLLFCYSSNLKYGSKSSIVWRISYLLIPVLVLQEISVVNAIPPLELATKLKEKIRKGKLLIGELNSLLDHVKNTVKEGLPVDKERLEELVDIKDKFKKLEVDPGDLPVDLMEKFKEKTLEAFGMILASFKLDKIPQAKDPELVEKFQEKVVHKVKTEFNKHMEKREF
ncbi:uncharacterized protein [Parasteatoda tepidariorum]|uniref:uncharacterized protein isoform X2 n=1 Tax=Parasteatoda tepidariorum TaxID=114398 RepID=UPI00077FCB09|nr:uncharacterized protein LOC107455701 isoform X2 [Parasteatoda tepidariorum]